MKLYTENNDPNGMKILAVAKYAGVTVNVAPVTDADIKKSIIGQVPFLETEQGVIFKSNAAARHVAKAGNANLFGANPFEAAQVEQWIEFAAKEIDIPAAVWVFPILGIIPNNAAAASRAKADVRATLEVLNNHLLTRTFLVGQRITLADIVVCFSLYYLYQRVLDTSFRKGFVNVNRWFLTIINQPNVASIVGTFKMSEKMEIAPEAAQPQGGEKKEEKKEQPKKEEKKKEEKKKEEKKEAPKKKEKEEEEEEDYLDESEKKPKQPNVLDLLPPPKMVFDEWKRMYSNNDTLKVAMPWLWEHFDKEGYSLWKAEYKYNEECTKGFMTANFIGGWIQRLDKLRKYGFGSLVIFGEEPKLEISCVWMFRGLDIPAEMKESDDCEHYEWSRLNPDDAATREMIGAYFAWEGFTNGKTFNQGKIFK